MEIDYIYIILSHPDYCMSEISPSFIGNNGVCQAHVVETFLLWETNLYMIVEFSDLVDRDLKECNS